MDLISLAQEQPVAVKWSLTAVIIILAGILIVVLWQQPRGKGLRGGQEGVQQAAFQQGSPTGRNDVTFVGANSGIVAGSYVAASPAQEELARQQLAELRERTEREQREAEKTKIQAAKDRAEKARLEKSAKVGGLIDRLRGKYLMSHDGLSAGMLAGTEPIPDEWMNAELHRLGVPYIYHGNPDGSFTYGPS